MQRIPISAIPNQEFSILLDGQLYDISLKFTAGVMAISITRDGTILISGLRAISGYILIPYLYLESGNFIFITEEGDYPEYSQFGITQFLVFASQLELEVIRAGN
jgi:hypothetical protein